MDKISTASVRLEHGHLTATIKNLTQSDWVKACERLGLWVPDGAGKGSHRCAYKEENCDRTDSRMLVATIQKHMTPNIQTDKLKQIVAYGLQSKKYSEKEVWKALGKMK